MVIVACLLIVMAWADVYVPHVSPLDAMGRRLRSPRLPGVDVPGVDASMSPASMRWADVYVSGLGPQYREVIDRCRRLLKTLGLTEKPDDKEAKFTLLRHA